MSVGPEIDSNPSPPPPSSKVDFADLSGWATSLVHCDVQARHTGRGQALQSPRERLDTGGLDDAGRVLQLRDGTFQDQYAHAFVAWGEGLECQS